MFTRTIYVIGLSVYTRIPRRVLRTRARVRIVARRFLFSVFYDSRRLSLIYWAVDSSLTTRARNAFVFRVPKNSLRNLDYLVSYRWTADTIGHLGGTVDNFSPFIRTRIIGLSYSYTTRVHNNGSIYNV